MEDDLHKDALLVIREVRRLRLSLVASLGKRLADEGITLAQFSAMEILEEVGESTMSALAKRMGTTLGAATNLADRLIAAGFATRKHSQTDRRVVNVSLTARGQEFVQRHHTWGADAIVRLLRELSPQERKTFLDVFGRLADLVEKDASRSRNTPGDPSRP